MNRPNPTLSFAIVVLMIATVAVAAQDTETPQPAIVVVEVEGEAQFARTNWTAPQRLTPGVQLAPDNLIYTQSANVTAVCADGRVREFQPQSNDILRCPPVSGNTLIIGEQAGTRRLGVTRGGAEDPNSPFLLFPRATTVRTPNVTLRWNAIPNASSYTVRILGDAETVWSSGRLSADEVHGEALTATVTPDITLAEATAYTVEICVTVDSESRCTTDPGFASTANLAFFYSPREDISAVETDLITELGTNTPESLYARAVLFSQPTDTVPGLHAEAIDLLEELLASYPNSPLAMSPEAYNLLGEQYQLIQLPSRAAVAYQQAATLAREDSESFAIAHLGMGVTALEREQVVLFYDTALRAYRAFLNDQAYTNRFQEVCGLIGEVCLDLPQCEDQMDACLVWFREGA